MEPFFIAMAVGILFLMLCNIYRVVAGPTVIDRMLGMNVIGTKTTVLIVLVGVIDGRVEMFIDITLAYALLNFITTIAAARFYQRLAQPAPPEPRESLAVPSAGPDLEEGDAPAVASPSVRKETP
ncbi:MAG: pH regulation protein F [Desulfotignum sp.]|nr:pH regulation protein F [Desulfotignum sp.]MCF8113303.1 pH regulation protein F [Desulfotignum sp.]MCF8125045.1 pH regulation protein F [Desulfotignum sp.]